LAASGFPGAEGESERGVGNPEVDDGQRERLGPIQDFGRGGLALRIGGPAERGFDETPQSHDHECDGGRPERDGAAWFGGQRRQCSGLIGATAAGTQRDPYGEVADDYVEQAADDVARSSGALKDGVLCDVRRGIGHTVPTS